MKISTKGRYALRFMLYLGMHKEGLVSLKEVSEKENISMKYLEQIVSSLNKRKMITSVRGAQGGYALNKEANEYSLKDILEVVEGPIACVACLENDVNTCDRKDTCATLEIYTELTKIIHDYLLSKTLQDLIDEKIRKNQ